MHCCGANSPKIWTFAFLQLMEIDVDMACIILFVICVFYTTMGGIKAVIWTDLFQVTFLPLKLPSSFILSQDHYGNNEHHKNLSTHIIQLFFMFIGTASMIFLGNQRAGGVLAVLEANSKVFFKTLKIVLKVHVFCQSCLFKMRQNKCYCQNTHHTLIMRNADWTVQNHVNMPLDCSNTCQHFS